MAKEIQKSISISFIRGTRCEFVINETKELHGRLIQEGFICDLATSPRWLWAVFPPFGDYLDASVVHDWDYVHKIGKRKEADRNFRSNMKTDGVRFVKRNVMYYYVRALGWVKWYDIL